MSIRNFEINLKSRKETNSLAIGPFDASVKHLPMGLIQGVVVRSFVLEREEGNVIIYNSSGINGAALEIMALGQPKRLLVNHRHESTYEAPKLNVPIIVHEADRAQALSRGQPRGAEDVLGEHFAETLATKQNLVGMLASQPRLALAIATLYLGMIGYVVIAWM